MTWYYNEKRRDGYETSSLVLQSASSLHSCASKPEPVLDEATVIAKNTSLRLKNSSTSRTLRVLDTGDKVDVLERQDNWYRVRYGTDVEGWMEESTVVTNETRNRIQKLVTASQNLEPQNTAVSETGCEHAARTGRSTSDHSKTGERHESRSPRSRHQTASRFGHIIMTCGSKFGRLRPRSAGSWRALSSSIFPNDIAQYSEDYIYAAVKMINRVQDPDRRSDQLVHRRRTKAWLRLQCRFRRHPCLHLEHEEAPLRNGVPHQRDARRVSARGRPGRRQSHLSRLRIERGRHDKNASRLRDVRRHCALRYPERGRRRRSRTREKA